MIHLLICVLMAPPAGSLERAAELLGRFKAKEALPLLEQARREGPYHFRDHVRLYEQIGIANAYLQNEREAREAFERVLQLHPGHTLSCELSPKVTLLFEEARRQASDRAPPLVDIDWPRNLRTSDPVPVDIEVISDPGGLMSRGQLFSRLKGAGEFQKVQLDLQQPGGYLTHRLELARQAAGPVALELYFAAVDRDGNQTYLLGSPEHPREIPLRYQEPESWYQKWWVWAIIGGVVAGGTGLTVYLTQLEPPRSMSGFYDSSPAGGR